MNKSEILTWMRQEYRTWEAFFDQIDPAHMDQPGVVGHWSIKDVIAHLTGWNRDLVARIPAAQRDEPEPPTPWPAHLRQEDDVNAWHYETNRDLSVREVREQAKQVFEALLAAIEALPDDVRIETVQTESGREYYRMWINDRDFLPGEFFYHYRDEHEGDVRAWLARVKNQ